ncbi:hypothetical protein INR49_022751 [Caranx melampygus]|nr:hypothetical protein INR49_022751 [Caranx melampygus]
MNPNPQDPFGMNQQMGRGPPQRNGYDTKLVPVVEPAVLRRQLPAAAAAAAVTAVHRALKPQGLVDTSSCPSVSNSDQTPFEEREVMLDLLYRLIVPSVPAAEKQPLKMNGPQREMRAWKEEGMGWHAASVNEAEVDGSGDVFSFPSLANEESLIGVSKPLPKQLWEAKKVQSLASRPKSCEVPGINIFPSPEQNPGLSHYQGSLNTGGSLPDLSNLHFPSPLSTPLDPEDNGGYPNLRLSSSLSNPSIQASLNNCQLQSSLSNPSINSSLRMSSNSPRRRPAPISPLTLSPGAEQRRGLAKQLSPTMSPSLSPITQLDQFSLLENTMSSTAGGSCFDPSSSSSSLYYSQAALSGLGGSHSNLQDHMHMRSSAASANDSNPSLSKDISSALSTVPECFDSEGGFPLEDELRIEPLSLDGLSMLSDPDMVLPDPSVEDTFRSDRL